MRWLAYLTLLIATNAVAAEPKFNVLWLATDDWRPEIHCYGVEGIQTPNVDKLAAGGVRFEHAYCQFPLCNPSRTSMLTGRYPTTTGVLDNDTYFRDAHPDWVTLPQFFHNHGYISARTGKIFHGGLEDDASWDEIRGNNSKGNAKTPARQTSAAAPPKRKQDPSKSDRRVVLAADGQEHVDYQTAERGIELLEAYRDRPFFIAVGFLKPHSPPTAPQKFYDLYDPAKITLPPDFAPRPAAPAGFPAASIPTRNGDLFINRDASPEEAREMIRAYRASASWTDWNCGRVLDALDRLGLAEKTIVVFFGDHGYHLGEKGKWSKHGSLYEVGARVPLIVRVPGAAGNGKASSRTVQLVDLYPTLAELCGLPKPAGIEGHSFASLINNPQADWSHPAITVIKNGRSIRTERWRYAEYNGEGGGAMLFDEQSDPHEMKNLAGDPRYADTISELKAAMSREIGNKN